MKNKYKVMALSENIKNSPTKLVEWLNAFTTNNNLELIAVDNGVYIFKQL